MAWCGEEKIQNSTLAIDESSRINLKEASGIGTASNGKKTSQSSSGRHVVSTG